VERWRRALGIDAAVRVLASAAVEAPVVVGWLKPVILWPAAALLGLPAHELDALVVHELAHVRRQDALMNLLQACIDVLFFHHPAAWWISGQVRAEREHCADDLAVRVLEAGHAGSRLSYAKALLALEERRQAHALALAANGGSLLDRIRRLAGVEEQPASPVRPLAAAVMASLLLAVLVMAAAPIREARADELPKDTNQIESLTVEQAKKLVEEASGRTVDVRISPRGAPHVQGNALSLNGVKALDAATAEILVDARNEAMLLGGLTELDRLTARALAKFKGNVLFLDGLKRLDAETARELARYEGNWLSLAGLTELDAEAAEALADSRVKGCLYLYGLKALSGDTAEALAGFAGGYCQLDGVAQLDVGAARALGKSRCYLYLNGLTALDAGRARGLAAYSGSVMLLGGVTTLDAETAKALAEFNGQHLTLGLTGLDAATAKALAEFQRPSLSLSSLRTLNADTAKGLAEFKGSDLELPGLTTLDATVAEALAEFKGRTLGLSGLTTLAPDTAKAIAQFKGHGLSLGGLTTLNADTAKGLAEFKGRGLFLNGLTTLDAATAESLADYKGGGLVLTGLTTLDADAAKALAGSKSRTLFLRLTTLDAEAAKALAEFKGEELHLGGLPTIDADTAKSLDGFRGFLFLSILDKSRTNFFTDNPLTRETALAWVVVSNGELAAVTALDSPDSVAIAKALAARKGRLSLPNLKKLSPKTLSALLEKEDIEIPLIETLELIPEPDRGLRDPRGFPAAAESRQSLRRNPDDSR
jgi:hypothetical protein